MDLRVSRVVGDPQVLDQRAVESARVRIGYPASLEAWSSSGIWGGCGGWEGGGRRGGGGGGEGRRKIE